MMMWVFRMMMIFQYVSLNTTPLHAFVPHNNNIIFFLFQNNLFFYEWLRNGKKLVSNNNTFEFFSNGSLKIHYSNLATGVYQCIVNATTSDNVALISNACHVQQGRKLHALY